MIFGLADFQRKTLEEKDEYVNFTVGKYAEKNGFKTRIRVYLTSTPAETIDSDNSSEEAHKSIWIHGLSNLVIMMTMIMME